MRYSGLLEYLNLDFPCAITSNDGKEYPSLLHALVALGQDPATKTFLFNGVYSNQEVYELWAKLPKKWDVVFIDQVIDLFYRKYSVLTNNLLLYTPDKVIYSKEEDPLQIFDLITQMLKNGKKTTDILNALDLVY